jgi:hypothetical protein
VDISTTDGVANGTTTYTSATANFGTSIVGNLIYFAGGSGSITGTWRWCTARASATSITLSSLIASSTGMTMNIGGALASPGLAATVTNGLNAASCVFVKAGTYSITSATAGVSGGTLNIGATTNTAFIGYSTNRAFGNLDTQPVFQLNVSSATMAGAQALIYNVTLDGNTQTGAALGTVYLVYCTVKNFNTTSGTGNAGFLIGCLFTANSCSFGSRIGMYCEAYANTATPFQFVAAVACLSYSNTGATTDGFLFNAFGYLYISCVAALNGRDGFRSGSTGNPSTTAVFQNCVAESNTGFGFNIGAGPSPMIACSTFGNTSGSISTTFTQTMQFQVITTPASVFNSATDYGLNALASKGAALRGAGVAAMGSVFPRGLTNAYPDIGAAQHADPIRLLVGMGMTGEWNRCRSSPS